MNANVGTVDRVIRIVIGLALVACAVSGLIGEWGAIGFILIGTGIFRFCPAYLPFHFSTCKLEKK